MKRVTETPRSDWRRTVEAQGLVYPMTDLAPGVTTPYAADGQTPYWFERAAYVFDEWEIDYLERVTDDLHMMCVEAARALAAGEFGDLGLSPAARELAQASLAADPVSIYGRFDLRYDGQGHAELYEYNADTPTGLVESAVAQWYWLQDVHPKRDQWNSLHERLVAAWGKHARKLAPVLHFAYSKEEPTGEEWMTTAYMRDTAAQAGLNTVEVPIEDIGFDPDLRRFVDLDGRPIASCFKLYPTEDLLADEFGSRIMADPNGTRWIEPFWKVVLSNKALLAALYGLFPRHDNLIPAYLDRPWGMESWIEKPLHGREGDGMKYVIDGTEHRTPNQNYGPEGYCYQQWRPLPSFAGNHPVLGAWVVDGHAAGLGIRESDGPITDYYARFVPHYTDAPTPASKTRAAWLAEDGVKT